MSEICPCGSELELKYCCVSEDIAALKKLFLNKLVVPERMEWALSYLEYKTIHNQHIVTGQKKYTESIGREITCIIECSRCCDQFIAARIEECDAVAIYLYLYPTLMNKFLTNYTVWYQRITSGDNILNRTSGAYRKIFENSKTEDKEIYDDLALEYARKDTPCPFLEDDKCIIYSIRPYTCSTYSVISAKKYCDPHLPEEEHLKNKLKIKTEKNPLFFDPQFSNIEYFIDVKESYIFGPMPEMVYKILKYGPSFLDGFGRLKDTKESLIARFN